MLALVVCLSLAADPDTSWADDQAHRLSGEQKPWMFIGGAAWAPIGAISGAAVGLSMPGREGLDTRAAVGATIGAVVGIGVGMLLGWAAENGSAFGKAAVIIPAIIEVVAVVVAGCGAYLLLGGR